MKKKDYGKISVIIPTYNRANLIEKSIKSVLEQSYKNIELIVVDDGSTDDTEKVIKDINDKRLKYIKLDSNQGACNARNVGIDNSNGDYIAFQDSDDIFDKYKLEKQIYNLNKKKSDLDFCSILVNLFDNTFVLPDVDLCTRFKNNNMIDLLCEGNFISTQAILAKRKVFDDIRFDVSLPRFQDYDIVLRIATKYSISFTNEKLVDLYRQNDSISLNDEKLKRACSIMIRKNYNLNDLQQKKLDNTLFYWATNSEMGKLNYKYNQLQDKFNSFETDYKQMKKSYGELNDRCIYYTNEYNKIISSKRWKIMNKFLKIIGK